MRKIVGSSKALSPVVALASLTCMLASTVVFAHSGSHDAHANHKAPAPTAVTRVTETYQLPAVSLVRTDGTAARFPNEIDDGKPVILNFVYTSCNSVCPLMSQIFSEVQTKLGKEISAVRMVSISIDPEADTPARLAEHARKIGASKHWEHYTGTAEASIAMQRAFKAYRGDKMSHPPATYLRAAPGKPWVRLDGFASADAIVREYTSMVRGKTAHSHH